MSVFGLSGMFGDDESGAASNNAASLAARPVVHPAIATVVAGNVGLSANGSFDPGDTYPGRVSLGLALIVLVGLGAAYIWTRNVQGGG